MAIPYQDLYEETLTGIKKDLPVRTENQSFDWWDDLFCASNPRKAMAAVIAGDTVIDKINKKSGKVVEAFVMPWRDDSKYREWVAAMRRKWNIDGNSLERANKTLISHIHYGGFVVHMGNDEQIDFDKAIAKNKSDGFACFNN